MKKHKITIASTILAGVMIMSSGCQSVEKDAEHKIFPDRSEILCRLKQYPLQPHFPPASDRKAWFGLSAAVRSDFIARAENAEKKPWPLLTAKDYMRFVREGSRIAYENPYFERRCRLIELVIGECCEYSGRFIDGVIEGLWQILSEPVWCLPAHEGLDKGEVFADPTRFKVDLFNASTGRILVSTLRLLEPELAKVSPALVQRVKMEVMRRVVEPAEKLNIDTAWWFSGRNNWTPWCASNISGCAIYLLDDQPERLADLLNTYLSIAIRFRDRYPEDGGCNEGPTYWGHAPGKYMEMLDLLDNRLQLQGRMYQDEKLRKMCDYLPGMNLCGDWFLSSNDSTAKPGFAPEFLNFVARRMNSSAMAALAQNTKPAKRVARASELDRLLITLFNPVVKTSQKLSFAPVNFWPNLGIAIMRQNPVAPEKGTVVSLKGGFNGESHNHLDLGHFTIMRNGKPLVVDPGVGTYTAQTFGAGRYDIWNIGVQGHNPPRFSGAGQIFGHEFTAKLAMNGDAEVAACLDNAYPAAVGVKKFTRKLTLDRKSGNVKIADTAEVNGSKKIEITLYTTIQPDSFNKSGVSWKFGSLIPENLSVVKVVEETRLDDKLKKCWKKLWRIELEGNVSNSGNWGIKFDFKDK